MAIKCDREYWDIFGSFIELANKHSDTVDYQKVSAALLHAAAHFNSFSIWAGADNIVKFKLEKDASRDYFSNEYNKLITESLDDFEANFDTYRIDCKR